MARPPKGAIHSVLQFSPGRWGLRKNELTEFPESHAGGLDSPPPKRVSSAFPELLAVYDSRHSAGSAGFRRISPRPCPPPAEASGQVEVCYLWTRKAGDVPLVQPFFLSIFRFSVM